MKKVEEREAAVKKREKEIEEREKLLQTQMNDMFEFMNVTGIIEAKNKYEKWVKKKRAK